MLLIIISQMSTHNNVVIMQDIPVEILTAAQIAAYVEPHLQDPEVHIHMPTLRSVRSVIDRMKSIFF